MATIDTKTIRTNRDEFQQLFTELADYFRFKTSAKVFDMYYRSTNHYPYKGIREIVDNLIFTGKPIPSMFPSIQVLVDQCAGWLNGHPNLKQTMTTYDEYLDEEFPVEFMHEAYTVLEHQGMESFKAYCKLKRMPLQDIERILCKANYNNDVDHQEYSQAIKGLDMRYALENRKRSQSGDKQIPILGKTVTPGDLKDVRHPGIKA